LGIDGWRSRTAGIAGRGFGHRPYWLHAAAVLRQRHRARSFRLVTLRAAVRAGVARASSVVVCAMRGV